MILVIAALVSLVMPAQAMDLRPGPTSSASTILTGPAGGDLTGTYPNPTIGTGKVTDSKVTLTTGAISSGQFPDGLVSITTGAISSGQFSDTRVSVTTGAISSGKFGDTRVNITTGAVSSGKFDETRVDVTTGSVSSGKFPDARVNITTGAIMNAANIAFINQINTFTSSQTVSVSSGIGTPGSTFVYAYDTGGNTFVAGQESLLNFNVDSVDVLSEYSTTTSSFTAQVAGKYLVQGSIALGSSNIQDTKVYGVRVYKNNTLWWDASGVSAAAATITITCPFGGIIQLVAGDKIAVHGYNGGTANIGNTALQNASWITISKIP